MPARDQSRGPSGPSGSVLARLPLPPAAVWPSPRLRLSPVSPPWLGGSAVLRRRPLDLDPRPNGGGRQGQSSNLGHYRLSPAGPELSGARAFPARKVLTSGQPGSSMAQTQRDSTSFGKTSIVRAEITNRGTFRIRSRARARADLEAAAPPVASRGTPAGGPRPRLSPVAAPPLGGVPVCLRVSAKPLHV